MPEKLERIKCPNCGSTRIEALIRHETTAYSTHRVITVQRSDGSRAKLVLHEQPLKRWADSEDYESELDEELKCLTCKQDFGIDEVGIESQDAYTYQPKAKAVLVP